MKPSCADQPTAQTSSAGEVRARAAGSETPTEHLASLPGGKRINIAQLMGAAAASVTEAEAKQVFKKFGDFKQFTEKQEPDYQVSAALPSHSYRDCPSRRAKAAAAIRRAAGPAGPAGTPRRTCRTATS